jgi:acyl transferase domain-containing protein
VGHLEAAAGVTGLIKTALALTHKLIPPSLHYERPNPKIDFENSPFYVNTTLTEWKAGATPRRAGVSSFGVGGTNAHAILEEAPAEEPSNPAPQLLLVSARAIRRLTQRLAILLAAKQHPNINLTSFHFTGRRVFEHRRGSPQGRRRYQNCWRNSTQNGFSSARRTWNHPLFHVPGPGPNT